MNPSPWIAKTSPSGATLLAALALAGAPGAGATPFPAAPPSIIQFSANPPQVVAGQRATLTWTISGGAPSALVLDQSLTGGPALNLTGRGALAGLRAVGRQTLTLKAGNPWGASQASLTLVARGLHVLAGDVSGPGSVDGPRAQASFRLPMGLARDGDALIVADSQSATIRRIAPDGQVTTLAGVPGRPGWEDGPGATARFNEPSGVAVDPDTGRIYVADTGNSVLRILEPGGAVTTLAGAPGQAGLQDGPGAGARFCHPQGLALLADGALVVADTGNSLLRRVAPDGAVTTLAGAPGTWGWQDGPAASAQFGSPWAVAVDAAQDVYVADTFNNAIRRLAGGQVTTVAGVDQDEGLVDGSLAEARFRWPMAIVAAEDGALFVADAGNGRIRKLAAGRVETLTDAGQLKDPQGLALDGQGALWVADTGNSLIRRLEPGGALAPFAGSLAAAGAGDAQGAKARFDHPGKIVVDPATGDALVADTGNGLLRRITPGGRVRTLELPRAPGAAPDGLQGVTALALDGAGTLYTARPAYDQVLRIPPGGPASPAMVWDGQGGPGAAPPTQDLVVDSEGSIFVTDPGSSVVRRIRKDGTVTVFAGRPGEAGSADGGADTAQFLDPTGIALDLEENLIVTDQGSHTVRRISRLGRVTTLAGTPGEAGSADGDGAHAQFNGPRGVAVDAQGNIFVADTGNFTIRRISPDGQVTTVAGVPGRAGALMGPLPGGLAEPTSVAVTPAGDLLVLCGNGVVQVTDP